MEVIDYLNFQTIQDSEHSTQDFSELYSCQLDYATSIFRSVADFTYLLDGLLQQ